MGDICVCGYDFQQTGGRHLGVVANPAHAVNWTGTMELPCPFRNGFQSEPSGAIGLVPKCNFVQNTTAGNISCKFRCCWCGLKRISNPIWPLRGDRESITIITSIDEFIGPLFLWLAIVPWTLVGWNTSMTSRGHRAVVRFRWCVFHSRFCIVSDTQQQDYEDYSIIIVRGFSRVIFTKNALKPQFS